MLLNLWERKDLNIQRFNESQMGIDEHISESKILIIFPKREIV